MPRVLVTDDRKIQALNSLRHAGFHLPAPERQYHARRHLVSFVEQIGVLANQHSSRTQHRTIRRGMANAAPSPHLRCDPGQKFNLQCLPVLVAAGTFLRSQWRSPEPASRRPRRSLQAPPGGPSNGKIASSLFGVGKNEKAKRPHSVYRRCRVALCLKSIRGLRSPPNSSLGLNREATRPPSRRWDESTVDPEGRGCLIPDHRRTVAGASIHGKQRRTKKQVDAG